MGRCLVCAAVLLGACAGGLHARGEQRLAFQANYGDPTSGHALSLRGNGTAENYGAGVGYDHFLHDRLAVSGTASYRYYDQSDGPVHAAEFDIGVRYFFWEIGDIAFSIDGHGGFVLASRSIPEAGTAYNFLAGLGPTVEIAIGEGAHLFFGYQFRHLSNGRGRSAPDNPTQNDHRVIAGVAIQW